MTEAIILPASLRLRFHGSFTVIADHVERKQVQTSVSEQIKGSRELYTVVGGQSFFPLYGPSDSVTACSEAILYDPDSVQPWREDGDFGSLPVVIVKYEQVPEGVWSFSFTQDGKYLGRIPA